MIHFEVQKFLDVAIQLIHHDETERALLVLNNLPAFYRDNEPLEITQLRNEIRSKIFTVQDYVENTEDYVKSNEQNLCFLNTTARGMELKKMLEAANKDGIAPHIVDYGPGDYGLPMACYDIGLKFVYTPVALQSQVQNQAKEKMRSIWVDDYKTSSDREKWFIAYEIIEHLHNPGEIRQVFDKIRGKVTKVLLSTPKYCYGQGNTTWRDRGIPHLRVYTPNEFYLTTVRMFPGFKTYGFIDNEVMVIKCEQ